MSKTFVGAEKLDRIANVKNLIVCQKSKIDDWVEHFNSYYEDYIVFDLTLKCGIRAFLEFDGLSVGVINYDLLFRRTELLTLKDFTLLLDESSLIQNEKTKRCKFIFKMNYKNVILLSGTIINGNYEKLWSQAWLLGWKINRELFYNQYVEFKTITASGFKHRVPIGYKNVNRLKRKMIANGTVFLNTEDVLELPKQTLQKIYVGKTKEYEKFKKDKIIKLENKVLVGDYNLTARLYEKMLCSQWNENKLKAFQDLVDSTNDRLVVFYTYTEELSEMLKHIDRPVSVVNGKLRDLTNYEKYNNSITFIQYQAGAMGLNLQKANKIIYFSLPEGWSEGFEQSKKRIHRVGQNRPCFYYLLLTKNSIEIEILKNLKARKGRNDFLFS